VADPVGEATLKALKIIGLVALVLWMALLTIQLNLVSQNARHACTWAYLAANPHAQALDYPCP
jgi:hypothetical protein